MNGRCRAVSTRGETGFLTMRHDEAQTIRFPSDIEMGSISQIFAIRLIGNGLIRCNRCFYHFIDNGQLAMMEDLGAS